MKDLRPILLIFFLVLQGASFVTASPGLENRDLNGAQEQKNRQAASERTGLILREIPRALNTEEIRALLKRYNFYATCWNNNKEFCNPEGDFQNHLIDNRNGTISDKATGLMWQHGGSPEPLTWQGAKAYAEKANHEAFAGHIGWRLPTIEELASLMERSWKNNDLFIDPIFDKSQRQCWSGDAKDGDTAWKADFHLGFFIDRPVTEPNSVRLVRTLF